MLQRLGQVARLPDLLDNHVRPGFGDRVLDVRVGVAGGARRRAAARAAPPGTAQVGSAPLAGDHVTAGHLGHKVVRRYRSPTSRDWFAAAT